MEGLRRGTVIYICVRVYMSFQLYPHLCHIHNYLFSLLFCKFSVYLYTRTHAHTHTHTRVLQAHLRKRLMAVNFVPVAEFASLTWFCFCE